MDIFTQKIEIILILNKQLSYFILRLSFIPNIIVGIISQSIYANLRIPNYIIHDRHLWTNIKPKGKKEKPYAKGKVLFENSWSTGGQEKQSILSFFLFLNMEVKHIMRRWSLSKVLILSFEEHVWWDRINKFAKGFFFLWNFQQSEIFQ